MRPTHFYVPLWSFEQYFASNNALPGSDGIPRQSINEGGYKCPECSELLQIRVNDKSGVPSERPVCLKCGYQDETRLLRVFKDEADILSEKRIPLEKRESILRQFQESKVGNFIQVFKPLFEKWAKERESESMGFVTENPVHTNTLSKGFISLAEGVFAMLTAIEYMWPDPEMPKAFIAERSKESDEAKEWAENSVLLEVVVRVIFDITDEWGPENQESIVRRFGHLWHEARTDNLLRTYGESLIDALGAVRFKALTVLGRRLRYSRNRKQHIAIANLYGLDEARSIQALREVSDKAGLSLRVRDASGAEL